MLRIARMAVMSTATVRAHSTATHTESAIGALLTAKKAIGAARTSPSLRARAAPSCSARCSGCHMRNMLRRCRRSQSCTCGRSPQNPHKSGSAGRLPTQNPRTKRHSPAHGGTASALPLPTRAESSCRRRPRVNTVAVCADEPPARRPAGHRAGPAVHRRPEPESGLPFRPRARLRTGVMCQHLLTAEGPEGTWRLSGLIDFEPAMPGEREYEFAGVGVFIAGPGSRS